MTMIAVKEWNRPPTQVSARLAMRLAVGQTEKGRDVFRMVSVGNIDPEITQERALATVMAFQMLLAYPIVSARLIVTTTKPVWWPELRQEKQVAEDEFEGSVAVMRSQTTTASQAGVPSQSQSNASFTTQMAQTPTTPTQVYSAPVIFAEEARVEYVGKIEKAEKKSFFQRFLDYFIDDSYLNKNTVTEEVAVIATPVPQEELVPMTPEATVSDYSQLLKNVQEAKASNNFAEQLRQNNYQIRYEDMFRSPFANTVAQVGYERPVQKIDVPVYGEQIE